MSEHALKGPMTIDGNLTVTGSIDCQSYCFGSITTETHKSMGSGTLPAVGPTENDQFIIINITGVHNQRENGDVAVYLNVTPNRGDVYTVSTHFTDTADDAPIWGASATTPVPKGSTYVIGAANYKGLSVDFTVTHINIGKSSDLTSV